MNRPYGFMRKLGAAFVMSVSLANAAFAQSTAITYQGQLKSSGSPAEGLHDIRFKLFSAVSGGSQVGTTQCVDNVSVKDGVFTAAIDFGPQFLSTADRWLEIEVRKDTGLSCGNTTGYTVLSPRQAITPAPRAESATTANALAIPNGSSVLVNLTNNGFVGIGTASPSSQLELFGVQDAVKITAYQPLITFRDTSSADARSILQGVNGGVFTVGERFLNGTDGTAFTWMDAFGNLAIGNYTPQAKLDVSGNAIVRGTVRMGPTAQYLATGGEENLRIVRGTISAGGGIVRGSGFSCTRTTTGRYSIVLNTPFAGVPSVTATVQDHGADSWISTDGVVATDFVINNVDPFFNGRDTGFHFIAVGPR